MRVLTNGRVSRVTVPVHDLHERLARMCHVCAVWLKSTVHLVYVGLVGMLERQRPNFSFF